MRTVAIIGAGTMGHSFAHIFAQGGYQVFLHDISEDVLEKARRLIAGNLDTLTAVGLCDANQKKEIMEQKISYTTELGEAVAQADFVVEAVIEDADTKKALFSELDRLAPPHTILASNTSYLDIYQFVETNRPDKVIITHWFAPPHIVPLVEIVAGPETSQKTIDVVKKMHDDMGKQTVVLKKFLPGFLANRLQAALTREVIFLLDNGYGSPEDIDKATKASFGLRIPILGLVKRLDFTGLDLLQKILKNKSYRPPAEIEKSPTVDDLMAQGRLGVKSGRGFYDYGGEPTEEILKQRDYKLLKLKKLLVELGELD